MFHAALGIKTGLLTHSWWLSVDFPAGWDYGTTQEAVTLHPPTTGSGLPSIDRDYNGETTHPSSVQGSVDPTPPAHREGLMAVISNSSAAAPGCEAGNLRPTCP